MDTVFVEPIGGNGHAKQRGPNDPRARSAMPQDKAACLEQLELKQTQLELRLTEEYLSMFNEYDVVSMVADRIIDSDGTLWQTINRGGDLFGYNTSVPFQDETGLRMIRYQSRWLNVSNGFARNLVENRVNYVVGSGFKYEFAPVDEDDSQAAAIAKKIQKPINKWLRKVKMSFIEQEAVRRADRDGESIIRRFDMQDGKVELRFVESDMVRSPGETTSVSPKAVAFGVEDNGIDKNAPVAFWIADPDKDASVPDRVPADDIAYLKMNVDSNVKRGIPTTYCINENLRRADKLLRNMSVVVAAQASIGMIRKHGTKNASNVVASFLNDKADAMVTNEVTGKTHRYRFESDPRNLDVPKNVDYEFPIVGVNVDKLVAALQAELRACAASVQMPEFMFTSDASNANFASTMVAEGPAVRSFQRLQDLFKDYFAEIVWKTVAWMIETGQLDLGALLDGLEVDSGDNEALLDALMDIVELNVVAPTLAVRDALQDTQKNQILKQEGVLSPQSWSQREDLDYEAEQANIDEHVATVGERQGPDLSIPAPGEDDAEDTAVGGEKPPTTIAPKPGAPTKDKPPAATGPATDPGG
jgi:hypothetical protein